MKRSTVKKAFVGDLGADTIILNLSAMGYGPFVRGKTVIFLDEIQECSDAETAIKFLVEGESYDYIESGSLLGINYKNSEDETEDSNEGILRHQLYLTSLEEQRTHSFSISLHGG